MAKQVINVDGQDMAVREDTAKAYRGVYWALLSIAGFILIAAIVFFSGLFDLATDNRPTPSPAENVSTGR
ncbi:MAG: hypothetical protein QUS14_05395 [Pyrinomonadaceae bacterium]|nr:hypothetical protein [Pyrinomonadaceae bacterium]